MRFTNRLLSRISPLLPRPVREEVVALREILRDGWRYQRSSSTDDQFADKAEQATRHEARLTVAYHRVEKGLALPEPRRPFGRTLRLQLHDLLSAHPESAAPFVEYGEDALQALDLWNERDVIDDKVSPTLSQTAPVMPGDQLVDFFRSRHSIRNFDPARAPEIAELRAAVELARNTPSVCNRQGFRVHFFRERPAIDAILRLQNGAKGFAHTVPTIAVVTVRRALFIGPFERNQRWVDGGLFAMTLVWALHGMGFATCMLNWSMPNRTSDRLRTTAHIPDDEDIVVLIAIGHAAEGARVARSPKRAVSDLAQFHS